MKKTLTLGLATLTLTGAMATTALADDGATRADIDRMLKSAQDYGFTHFDEFGVDDGDQFEVEGWGEDGSRLDVDMSMSDGSVLREQKRQSEVPDWSLSSDEVSKALDGAQEAGLEHIGSLDVDRMGQIEIEGYDAQFQELELRMNRETFEVLKVVQDD